MNYAVNVDSIIKNVMEGQAIRVPTLVGSVHVGVRAAHALSVRPGQGEAAARRRPATRTDLTCRSTRARRGGPRGRRSCRRSPPTSERSGIRAKLQNQEWATTSTCCGALSRTTSTFAPGRRPTSSMPIRRCFSSCAQASRARPTSIRRSTNCLTPSATNCVRGTAGPVHPDSAGGPGRSDGHLPVCRQRELRGEQAAPMEGAARLPDVAHGPQADEP